MQDTITRSTRIRADIERVWDALTTAEGIRRWFGDQAEIDLRPGGEAHFGWTEYGSSNHAIVVAVERPTHFSYRWSATGAERADTGPSTLVEFTLAETAGGTDVTVVESGFASLPAETIEQNLRENTAGWKAEMQDLVEYLEAATT
ncbi:MAG: SRPBCC domain-containing protein [Actinomycetota bacterium]